MSSWLTLKQAAAELQCSESTVRQMLRDGRLTRYTLNGKAKGELRIWKDELGAAMRCSPVCPVQKEVDRIVGSLVK